ncbi:MAG TPA: 5-oxoprolinase subunit PxpB [Gemmatimonadales bacterium]|nr:5-oxoprolinase subunit PxpB [Gemmatimonadales bacterium]
MIRWLPLGDSALTLVFGDAIDPLVHGRILAVARRFREQPPRGVSEVVPAYTTLGVWFNPLERNAADLASELVEIAEEADGRADGQTDSREFVIPVHYDGPDLDEVASRLGITRDEVIRRHTATTYRVYLLGFVPGFAFLGLLDPSLELPRRSSPRLKVPAGSVAIAGRQTAVYPLDTPGGWHLLGRTDLTFFDPRRNPPALLGVGDAVRFEAIS